MEGLAIVGFFTAVAGFVSGSAWYRVGKALNKHGALDGRFKSDFSDATTASSIFLFLCSLSILLGMFVFLP